MLRTKLEVWEHAVCAKGASSNQSRHRYIDRIAIIIRRKCDDGMKKRTKKSQKILQNCDDEFDYEDEEVQLSMIDRIKALKKY